MRQDTIEIKEGKVSKAFCKGIKLEVETIHPCLASDHYAVIYAILAEELNIKIYQYDPSQPIPEEQYDHLLQHLLLPLLNTRAEPLSPSSAPTSKEFSKKYYTQLKSMYHRKNHASGISYIENVRSEAERYIFWVLDQSSFRFKNLDRNTRVRLYSQIFWKSGLGSDLQFMNNFYWREPERYDYLAGELFSNDESDIVNNETYRITEH